MSSGSSKILIYSPIITKRLEYIANIVFNRVLNLDFEITPDKEVFRNSGCPKFSYSPDNLFPDSPFLSAHSLLFETNIHKINIDIFEVNDFKAFFRSGDNSFLPFDVLAASFYLIVRYEEYLPFKADRFGRFDATESIAFKEGFLEIPIVNIWIEMLGNELSKLFPELKTNGSHFTFISTIDVDNAWAHLNKGFARTFLSLFRLLLSANFKGFLKKLKVLIKAESDPYDNFTFIDETHRKYKIDPIYFVLFSHYGKYDKNPFQRNRKFRKLIEGISGHSKIGLHPSFHSNRKKAIVNKEKKMLEQLIGKQISISRQHFLIMKMPDTYENLIDLGILTDYSMGYSTHPGFRAGFCFPFQFFNLKTNHETALEVIPFALMDVSFREHQKIMPEIALIQIKNIISSIKKVNGLFVSLWHNETFAEDNASIGWRYVFDQMLKELQNGNQVLK